jgi:hypothetical protein
MDVVHTDLETTCNGSTHILFLVKYAFEIFDHYHCVPLTPEIVYQASGRTMTDRTHEVGIS